MPSGHPYDFTGQNANLGQTGAQGVVTIANTASKTLLHAGITPMVTPAPGNFFHLKGWGIYSDTGTPTLTIATFLGGIGGVALAAVPAVTLGATVTNVPFSFDAWLNWS